MFSVNVGSNAINHIAATKRAYCNGLFLCGLLATFALSDYSCGQEPAIEKNVVGFSIDMEAQPAPEQAQPQITSSDHVSRSDGLPMLTAVLRHDCHDGCVHQAGSGPRRQCVQHHTDCRYHPSNCTQSRWQKHIQNKQASSWGYPKYFEERPLGVLVDSAIVAQVGNGIRDQSVLYEYDFMSPPFDDQLSPWGKRHLQQILLRAEQWGVPIVINSTVDDQTLDGRRRAEVIQMLARWESPIDPSWVITGYDPVNPMHGVEAALIQQNQLTEVELGPVGGTQSPNRRSEILLSR